MILITQGVIIVVLLVLLVYGLGSRRTYATKAWKKIGLIFLTFGMVVAVLFPEATTRLAHVVGVGRGADLLLYILTLSFVTYAVNNYLHQQDEKDALYRLARKTAILDAQNRYSKDIGQSS